jgi:hypothetical protein
MAGSYLHFLSSLLLFCPDTLFTFLEIVSATALITPAPNLNDRVVQDRAIIDSYCAWWTEGTTSMLPLFRKFDPDLSDKIVAWQWTCGYGVPCVIATYLSQQIVFCSNSGVTPDTSWYGWGKEPSTGCQAGQYFWYGFFFLGESFCG